MYDQVLSTYVLRITLKTEVSPMSKNIMVELICRN